MSKTTWIFAAITLACVSLEGSALACGTELAPPPRPQRVQLLSFHPEACHRVTRAHQLDSAATTRERNAAAFDTEADALASRARRIRNQAQLVSFTTDRENLLEIADELSERAQVSRSRATSERMRASEMRSEATNLRNRATQLVRFGNGNGGGGGGGWRGGPRKTASEGVTL